MESNDDTRCPRGPAPHPSPDAPKRARDNKPAFLWSKLRCKRQEAACRRAFEARRPLLQLRPYGGQGRRPLPSSGQASNPGEFCAVTTLKKPFKEVMRPQMRGHLEAALLGSLGSRGFRGSSRRDLKWGHLLGELVVILHDAHLHRLITDTEST